MIDIKLFRENPEIIKESQRRRGEDVNLVDQVIKFDVEWRKKLAEAEKLRHERNVVAAKIAELKKKGKPTKKEIENMSSVTEKIAAIDTELKELLEKRDNLRMAIPNILDKSVPDGETEEDNVEIRKWGEIKKFPFTPKSHVDLGLELGLFDTERAAKVAGARFYYLKSDLVKLNYALIMFGLDFLAKKGFLLMQPPFMLNKASISGAIPLTAFEEMIYKIQDEDLYLIGTAEHALVEYYKDEVLNSDQLPIRFAGVSSCFRKEAGAHGKDTKGIFRVHQFEKVEQVVFCTPEDSWNEFEFLAKNTEEIFKLLEIPYRVVVLCSKETGRVASKTYDLEGWMPAQNKYRELGSCSNALDYQAIRSNIRFREGNEIKHPHIINNTAIATERTIAAIIENHQQKDGTIKIPKALWQYTGFKEISKK